jgi:hypothetical protein
MIELLYSLFSVSGWPAVEKVTFSRDGNPFDTPREERLYTTE